MKYIKYLPMVLLSLSSLKGILFGCQFTDAPICAVLGFLTYQVYFLEETMKLESSVNLKLEELTTKVYKELTILTEETGSLKTRVDSVSAKNMLLRK